MRLSNILIFALFISACDTKKTTEISDSYMFPESMKDCRVYFLQSENSKNLYVVKCGKSVTTEWTENRSCGKNCHTTETYSVSTGDEE